MSFIISVIYVDFLRVNRTIVKCLPDEPPFFPPEIFERDGGVETSRRRCCFVNGFKFARDAKFIVYRIR